MLLFTPMFITIRAVADYVDQTVPKPIKPFFDLMAIVGWVTALAGMLTSVVGLLAAILSFIWGAVRLYETKTFQEKFLPWYRKRFHKEG